MESWAGERQRPKWKRLEVTPQHFVEAPKPLKYFTRLRMKCTFVEYGGVKMYEIRALQVKFYLPWHPYMIPY
jgi:hypothetical protein